MDQDRAADFVRRFAEFWQSPAPERLDTVRYAWAAELGV